MERLEGIPYLHENRGQLQPALCLLCHSARPGRRAQPRRGKHPRRAGRTLAKADTPVVFPASTSQLRPGHRNRPGRDRGKGGAGAGHPPAFAWGAWSRPYDGRNDRPHGAFRLCCCSTFRCKAAATPRCAQYAAFTTPRATAQWWKSCGPRSRARLSPRTSSWGSPARPRRILRRARGLCP